MTTPTGYKPTWAMLPDDDTTEDTRDVQQLLADHLARYNGRDETQRKYHTNITQFLLWLEYNYPKRDPLQTTPRVIDTFRTYLRSNHWDEHPGPCSRRCKDAFPYKETSIDTKLAAISEFFKYCVREGRSPVNPVQAEKGVVYSEGLPHDEPILLPWDITTLGECARAHSLRDEVMVGFLVGMGLRREELANVDVKNFRPCTRGRYRLWFRRKGNHEALLDVPDRLADLVDAYCNGRKTGALLMNSRQRYRDPQTGTLEWRGITAHMIRNRVAALGAEAGLHVEGIRESVTPHLLRHSAATLFMTDPNASDARVMGYMGHLNFNTTIGYRNHPRLPGPGYYPNPYGPDWSRQVN